MGSSTLELSKNATNSLALYIRANGVRSFRRIFKLFIPAQFNPAHAYSGAVHSGALVQTGAVHSGALVQIYFTVYGSLLNQRNFDVWNQCAGMNCADLNWSAEMNMRRNELRRIEYAPEWTAPEWTRALCLRHRLFFEPKFSPNKTKRFEFEFVKKLMPRCVKEHAWDREKEWAFKFQTNQRNGGKVF